MTRGSRKKKIDKQPRSPTIVSPSTRTEESTPLPRGVAKLQSDRTVLISREIFVAAPVERCFGMIASQLEQPREWDMMITDVEPVSKVRGRIGTTSQVMLNLGGKTLDSLAMISRYRPNRAISLVLSQKPKVREDWRLEAKPHGTMVSVHLAYEIPGWTIGRFLYKVMRRKKVEQDLDKTLTQLKAVAESISRDQGG